MAQVFSILGVFAGLWAALLVSRWLDEYWRGAQPILVFMVLRWIVAALAGMGAASLFQWWGELLGRAVRSGPVGWFDRGTGLGVGALIGVGTCTLLLMVGLTVPGPRVVPETVARAHAAEPMMATAARACSLSARALPGGPWLGDRFRKAHRRALTAGTEARKTKS